MYGWRLYGLDGPFLLLNLLSFFAVSISYMAALDVFGHPSDDIYLLWDILTGGDMSCPLEVNQSSFRKISSCSLHVVSLNLTSSN